jgi:uncharacterized protein (TIGR02145 family)
LFNKEIIHYKSLIIQPATTVNGNKNVCPTGWHVPTDAEWTVLTDYLGGVIVAGDKMKEVGITSWNSPNIEATNTSLFTGLPGGTAPTMVITTTFATPVTGGVLQ